MKKSYFHYENQSEQKEAIEIKNNIEEKTNNNDEDNELTAGNPNIPVVSDDEVDESMSHADKRDYESVASNSNIATTNTKFFKQ